MANIIKNFINFSIKCENKSINQIKREVDEIASYLIDFNKIIPMPEDIYYTTRDSISVQFEKLLMNHYGIDMFSDIEENVKIDISNHINEFINSNKLKYLSQDQWKLRIQRYINNVKQYGSIDSYDWSWKNWNTDRLSSKATEDFKVTLEQKDINTYTVEIYFVTAWNNPFKVIQAISQRFPDLLFQVKSYNEFGEINSAYSIKNRKPIKNL